jgi:hypothetical protein
VTLLLSTPCETCRGTGWIPDDPDGWDAPDMSMSGCPDCQPPLGGTGRRSLTPLEPDIEAAAQAMYAYRYNRHPQGWADDPGIQDGLRNQASSIIAAALHLEP